MPRRVLSRELLRRSAAAAVLTAALGLAAVWFPPTGRWLENLSYDALFILQPARPPGEAIIVRMDDRSTQELGQGEAERWDRTIHARILDRLREAGARAVAFDLFFGVAQTNPPGADQELLGAAKRHGRVAVAASSRFERGLLTVQRPFEPLASQVAVGVAERSAGDQVFRRPWTRNQVDLPGLPESAARLAGSSNRPPAGAWLRYYGPAGSLPSVSLIDVYNGRETNFAGRVVFIGKDRRVPFFNEPESDIQRTPHTRWSGALMPGVEIVTTAFLNTLRGEWIHTLSPWRQFAWIGGLGAVLGGGLRLLRPKHALLLAVVGAAGMAVAAIHFGRLEHVTWPWAVLGLVQIPAALVWSVVAHHHELVVTRALTPAAAPLAPSPAGPPADQQDTIAMTSRGPTGDEPTPSGRPAVPNYEMLSCVGRGGYGEVWLARDLVGSYHAVKLIYRRSFEDDRPYHREFRGIRMFSPISRLHPGLLQILHIGRNEAGGYFYYVMEAGDDERRGTDIDPRTYQPKTLLSDLRPRGRYPAPEAVRLGIALGDALAFLHSRGLIHRDIKPANILFVRGQPKLADIGLVTKLTERPEDTTYLGTRGFIAPEGPGTASADVYGLGKVIFVAVTGGSPGNFPPAAATATATDAALNPALTSLLAVLERACADNPERRYQTANEFVAALRTVAKDIAQPAFS